MKTTVLIANEGVAKVGSLTLIGRGAEFSCRKTAAGWEFTLAMSDADVFGRSGATPLPSAPAPVQSSGAAQPLWAPTQSKDHGGWLPATASPTPKPAPKNPFK